jgi:hypothetical protein
MNEQDTKWLTEPGEVRTANWWMFDKEITLSLDEYLKEFLVNKYRLKLKEFYPNWTAAQIRKKLTEFREHLGQIQA